MVAEAWPERESSLIPPDDADPRRIADYVMPRTPLERADLGMVFGTPHHQVTMAASAAQLWRDGLVRRFAVAGGSARGGSLAEAAQIAELMSIAGVPRNSMLIETKSRNTYENVDNCIRLLGAANELDEIGSVIAVCKIFATRRCLMTLHRHIPGAAKMAAPVNYFGVRRESWHLDPELRSKVLQELSKIRTYLLRGHLAELD